MVFNINNRRTLPAFAFIALLFMSASVWADTSLEQIKQQANTNPVETLSLIEQRLTLKTLPLSERLELMLIESQLYSQLGYLDKSQQSAVNGEQLASAHNNFRYEIEFKLMQAEALSQMSDWPNTKKAYTDILKQVEQSNHQDKTLLIALTKSKYGLSCYYNGENQLALDLLFDAFEKYQAIDTEMVPTVLANIALVYDATGDHHTALKYFFKSLEYYDTDELELAASVTYYNIGYVSLKVDKFKQAETYLKKSEQIARKHNITQGIAFATSQLGTLAIKQDKFEQALIYLNEAYSIAIDLKNDRLVNRILVQLLQSHIKLGNIAKVRNLINQIIPDLNQSSDAYQVDVLKLVSKFHADQNHYEQAINHYQQLIALLEETIDKTNTEQIRDMQNQFSNQLREQENQILKQQNELQKLKISEQQNQTLIFILGSAALLIAAVFMTLFWRREKQVRHKFTQLALTDELTGVPNRRQIVKLAEAEFSRHQRTQVDVIYCIIDLDHFKNINDTYGHDVGDIVLKKFAQSVKRIIREHDSFGRVGGEEWLLVLPRLPDNELTSFFMRIREACSAMDIPEIKETITVSMGAAKPEEHDRLLESVLKRADKALYRAKENGRDQVVLI